MAIQDAIEFKDTIRVDLKKSSFSGRATIEVRSANAPVDTYFRLFKVQNTQRIISLQYFGGVDTDSTLAGSLVLLSVPENKELVALNADPVTLLPSGGTTGQIYNVYGAADKVLIDLADKTIAELTDGKAGVTPTVYLALKITAAATETDLRLVYEGAFG